MTIQRLHSGKRISRVVIHNDTVYLAGIVPLGKRGAREAPEKPFRGGLGVSNDKRYSEVLLGKSGPLKG